MRRMIFKDIKVAIKFSSGLRRVSYEAHLEIPEHTGHSVSSSINREEQFEESCKTNSTGLGKQSGWRIPSRGLVSEAACSWAGETVNPRAGALRRSGRAWLGLWEPILHALFVQLHPLDVVPHCFQHLLSGRFSCASLWILGEEAFHLPEL